MSSYATVSDMQGFLPKYPIDATTKPSETQVQDYLDDISARLDGILESIGYTTPISSAAGIRILKQMCLVGTGYWMTRILYPNATSGLVIELRDEFMQMLQDLKMGNINIPGAGSSTEQVAMDWSDIPICGASSMNNPWYYRDLQF